MRESVRRVALAAILGGITVGLLGMGGFGGREPEAPARDFRATFVDVDGAHMDVNRVTAGGEVRPAGEVRRGCPPVPFANMRPGPFPPSATHRGPRPAGGHMR